MSWQIHRTCDPQDRTAEEFLKSYCTSIHRNCKLLFGVLFGVQVLLVLLALSFAVAVLVVVFETKQKLHDIQLQLGEAEKQTHQDNDTVTSASIGQPVEQTHPAAHIVGDGNKWELVDSRTAKPHQPASGYNAQLEFNNDGASFVDGGMLFNKTEQKLYIPTCGYYFISSQVTFQSNSYNESQYYARHNIKIETKCKNKTSLILRSFSSFPAIPDRVYIRRTTTHAGGIVKMCTGGSIFMSIPSGQPCCPIGLRRSTHLSVFMVAKTICFSH